eukprot:COSAG03_NODE_4001_length_1725_cov_1.539360_1_plen_426_part_00
MDRGALLCLGPAELRERTDGTTRSATSCAKISCSAARRLARTVHVAAAAAAAAAQKPQSPIATGQRTSASALSTAQKTELYHQGFTIVRGAVAPGLIQAARRLSLREKGAGQSQEVLALLRDSSLNPILADLVGTPRLDISSEHGDWGCYPTIKPAPAQKSLELTAPSIISRDLHVDGLSAARLADGSVVDWIDAAETVAVKPFRHFVFVSLNDQTQLGCGQTHVLSEGHLAMTEFFKWQLAACGKVGTCVDGWLTDYDADWPQSARDRRKTMPSAVREYFSRSARTSVGSEGASHGKRLPRPTPLLLGAGDAAIATFALPHAGSPNDCGDERQQMIFRFVPRELEESCKAGNSLTFPAWAPRTDGSWYPVGDQGCEAVRQQLADCWRGWAGMQLVVEKESAATELKRAALQQHFREHAVRWAGR